MIAVTSKIKISLFFSYLFILIASPVLTVRMLNKILIEMTIPEFFGQLWLESNLSLMAIFFIIPFLISICNLSLIIGLMFETANKALVISTTFILFLMGAGLLSLTNNVVLPVLILLTLLTEAIWYFLSFRKKH